MGRRSEREEWKMHLNWKKQQCNLVDIQAAGIQIALSSELNRIENLQGLLMKPR